jgi:hypothetical protein
MPKIKSMSNLIGNATPLIPCNKIKSASNLRDNAIPFSPSNQQNQRILIDLGPSIQPNLHD